MPLMWERSHMSANYVRLLRCRPLTEREENESVSRLSWILLILRGNHVADSFLSTNPNGLLGNIARCPQPLTLPAWRLLTR